METKVTGMARCSRFHFRASPLQKIKMQAAMRSLNAGFDVAFGLKRTRACAQPRPVRRFLLCLGLFYKNSDASGGQSVQPRLLRERPWPPLFHQNLPCSRRRHAER
jgi:hypothetical protein